MMPIAEDEGRKKISLYLHPGEEADRRSLEHVATVARKKRGDLYRDALIAGLFLHQIDERLPALVTELSSKEISENELIKLISATTGWKPNEAAIIDVIETLIPSISREQGTTSRRNVVEPEEPKQPEINAARDKLKSLI